MGIRTSVPVQEGDTNGPSRHTGVLDLLVRASLEHPFFTGCVAAVLLAAGGWVAATLPVDVFPDLTAPTVTVLTDAHGLAPEEVESLVTFPIEAAVNGATGVRRVRSSSAQGISIVWVDFDWGTDIFRARQIVGERLQPVAARLPEDVTAPILAPITSIMGEILLVGLSAPEDRLMEARTAADWVVRPRLLAVPGVAQVVAIGGQVRQYQVLVDPERLLAYDVGAGPGSRRRHRIQPQCLGGTLSLRRRGDPHPRTRTGARHRRDRAHGRDHPRRRSRSDRRSRRGAHRFQGPVRNRGGKRRARGDPDDPEAAGRQYAGGYAQHRQRTRQYRALAARRGPTGRGTSSVRPTSSRSP